MPPTKPAENSRLVELRSKLQEIEPELIRLSEKPTLTDEEQLRWDDLDAQQEVIRPEYEKLEERAAKAAEIRQRTFRQISGLPAAKKPAEDYFGVDVRTMAPSHLRDAALTIIDDPESSHVLRSHQGDKIEKIVRSQGELGQDLAKRIIVTENDAYRNAFHKLMSGRPTVSLTQDEQIAMLRYEEYRAQSEGTTTAGGFAIPVFIDPSVILTDQETDNPFLTIARQVEISTNAWKGISAAGVSWSFDAEGAAVSDDSVALAQPTVTAFTARGFIPYSIEVGDDWPGFQAEMGRLLGEGYDELLLQKFTSGNGTTEPRGLITALDANTNVEVTSTTDGTFGAADVYKVWKALPQKYRRRASWMSSVDVDNQIRQFGNGNNFGNSTVDLTASEANMLMGKPWYENPYFPDMTGTTGAENRLVVGDFSNYVVARRTGMNVEFVPQLFDVTNNRPTGQRGWFAYARIGGNSVNDLAFRLLQNQ
jgi:HK97 family phage major capsid protein